MLYYYTTNGRIRLKTSDTNVPRTKPYRNGPVTEMMNWIHDDIDYDMNAYLVVDGEIVARPVIPYTISSTTAEPNEVITITTEPNVRYRIESSVVNESGTDADGVIEFESEVPGDYLITIQAEPYLPVSIEVTING